jgi:hypothetical protein
MRLVEIRNNNGLQKHTDLIYPEQPVRYWDLGAMVRWRGESFLIKKLKNAELQEEM